MEKKNGKRKSKAKIFKWSAFGVHVIILYMMLMENWFVPLDVIKDYWYMEYDYYCTGKFTILKWHEMMSVMMDKVGERALFSDMKWFYNIYLFISLIFLCFFITEVLELIWILEKKKEMFVWSLAVGLNALAASLYCWAVILTRLDAEESFLQISPCMLACTLLPYLAMFFWSKYKYYE